MNIPLITGLLIIVATVYRTRAIQKANDLLTEYKEFKAIQTDIKSHKIGQLIKDAEKFSENSVTLYSEFKKKH